MRPAVADRLDCGSAAARRLSAILPPDIVVRTVAPAPGEVMTFLARQRNVTQLALVPPGERPLTQNSPKHPKPSPDSCGHDPHRRCSDAAAWDRINMLHTMGAATVGISANLAAYTRGGPWLDSLLTYLRANRDHLSQALPAALPGLR